MEQILIYHPNGTSEPINDHGSVSVIKKAEHKKVLLGEDIITMTVESATVRNFGIGDYIQPPGMSKYRINQLPTVARNANRKYQYDINFEGPQYDLMRVMYRNSDQTMVNSAADFFLMGNLEAFLNVIINNLNRVFDAGTWALGDFPADTETRNLSFAGENCLTVLQRLCDEYKQQFVFAETDTQTVLHVRTLGTALNYNFKYGQGKGLYKLTRENVDAKNMINTLWAYGSSKNIPSNYKGYSPRLRLGDEEDEPALEANSIAAFGKFEGSVIFEEIYPHRTGSVTGINETNVYMFSDDTMDFDLNAKDDKGNWLYVTGSVKPKVIFQTGDLAGYQFDVIKYNSKLFTISKYTDERGMEFPTPLPEPENPDGGPGGSTGDGEGNDPGDGSGGGGGSTTWRVSATAAAEESSTPAFRIKPGDKYILVDITMPESYILVAENKLADKVREYLDMYSYPTLKYSLELDEVYLKSLSPTPNIFEVGDTVNIEDEVLSVNNRIKIGEYTRDLLRPYKYQLVIQDVQNTSIIKRIIINGRTTKELEKDAGKNFPSRPKNDKIQRDPTPKIVDTLNYSPTVSLGQYSDTIDLGNYTTLLKNHGSIFFFNQNQLSAHLDVSYLKANRTVKVPDKNITINDWQDLINVPTALNALITEDEVLVLGKNNARIELGGNASEIRVNGLLDFGGGSIFRNYLPGESDIDGLVLKTKSLLMPDGPLIAKAINVWDKFRIDIEPDNSRTNLAAANRLSLQGEGVDVRSTDEEKDISFYLGNTRSVILNADGLGIGVEAPEYTLDVAGDINTSTYYSINGVRVGEWGQFQEHAQYASLADIDNWGVTFTSGMADDMPGTAAQWHVFKLGIGEEYPEQATYLAFGRPFDGQFDGRLYLRGRYGEADSGWLSFGADWGQWQGHEQYALLEDIDNWGAAFLNGTDPDMPYEATQWHVLKLGIGKEYPDQATYLAFGRPFADHFDGKLYVRGLYGGTDSGWIGIGGDVKEYVFDRGEYEARYKGLLIEEIDGDEGVFIGKDVVNGGIVLEMNVVSIDSPAVTTYQNWINPADGRLYYIDPAYPNTRYKYVLEGEDAEGGLYTGALPISVSGNVISISMAGSGTSGALSAYDWNNFNSKFSLPAGGANGQVLMKSGSTAVWGTVGSGGSYSGAGPISISGSVISIATAGASQAGALSAADWLSFNNKFTLPAGGSEGQVLTRTGSGTAWASVSEGGLYTGAGPIAVSGAEISIAVASASQAGALSAADWAAFNNKLNKPAGGSNGQVLMKDGSNVVWGDVAGGGTYAGNAPIFISAGFISISTASSTVTGALSADDWNTFNNKMPMPDNEGVSGQVLTKYGSSTRWENAGAAYTGNLPITVSGNYISIQQATAAQSGYLTFGDWNTFNSKFSLPTGGSNGQVLMKSGGSVVWGSVSSEGVYTGTSPISVSGGSISIQQASGSQPGYLSTSDWNVFHSKLASPVMSGSDGQMLMLSGGLPVWADAPAGGTGYVGNSPIFVSGNHISISMAGSTSPGALSADDWNTFNNKMPMPETGTTGQILYKLGSGVQWADAPLYTGTSPISVTGSVISVATAGGSQKGVLSAEDWNTFNNKFSLPSGGSNGQVLTKSGSSVVWQDNSYTASGPLSISGNNIQIQYASAANAGALSASDWTTFNNKLSPGFTTTEISTFRNQLKLDKEEVGGYPVGLQFNRLSGGTATQLGGVYLDTDGSGTLCMTAYNNAMIAIVTEHGDMELSAGGKVIIQGIELDMTGFAVGKVLMATATGKATWVTPS
ncbi:phage tail protein [Emticicia sp. TH156]|uniref:phage tail protein n=1 Tax=Emticicia sp. TH156 TaxID=2067454 RepID=UPI000C766AC0|nr:phage tail protein [Emticicia sp. TH156]PLK44494.1 hypothetical protein C0V77_11975 [Emticicia sp. TH156]